MRCSTVLCVYKLITNVFSPNFHTSSVFERLFLNTWLVRRIRVDIGTKMQQRKLLPILIS